MEVKEARMEVENCEERLGTVTEARAVGERRKVKEKMRAGRLKKENNVGWEGEPTFYSLTSVGRGQSTSLKPKVTQNPLPIHPHKVAAHMTSVTGPKPTSFSST